ncbi:MAG: ParB/RepB/Spo0J family partition protein [Phycisphaerales bacterium]
MVAVGEIVPSRFQPRRHFDAAALSRLADSIKTAGVMQPLVVRANGQLAKESAADGTPAPLAYELVAGERRWRAAQMAGVQRVPCVVVEISDEESAEWGLIENVQREDLLPMERAGALANLAEKFSLTQAQVAERVGMERSSVANLVRLLELDEKVQRAIDEGALSVGHGKALLSIGRESARLPWGQRAAREGWSVRQLEERIAQAVVNVDRDSALKDEAMDRGDELPDGTEEEIRRRARKMMMANLEKRLSNHLGTKVQLRTDRTGNRGKITVHFYTVAQFDGVLEKMGVGEGE